MNSHQILVVVLAAFVCGCYAFITEYNNNIRRLPGNIKPISYKIGIHPYFDAPGVIYDPEKDQTFDGEVVILATVVEPTSTIILNAMNLTIPSSNFSVFSITNAQLLDVFVFFLTPENQTFTIELDRELEQDEEIMILLEYSGQIGYNTEFGLFKSKEGDDVVYATQFETTGARYVFPSFDEPDYKATFEITIVKPKSWIALSNTINISTIDIGNGYEEVEFEKTEIMSTYLVAFGIGDLIKIEGYTSDGILTRVWSLRSKEGMLKAALDAAIKCTDSMTKYTGFNLPLKKIDHLGIPYFGGAMENFGLIVYDQGIILFNSSRDKLSDWLSKTPTICHELSHHWFGDVVTNKWWGDIFLHEGFADFFQFKAMALAYPKEKEYMDLITVKSKIIPLKINDRSLNFIHPIITQSGFFDYITYDIGGAVIRQLEAVITPKVFQEGLQNYIQKYQFSNANYQQLLDEIQDAVDETELIDWCFEPFNVTKFMDLWLNQKGHPNLHIDFLNGIFSVNQNVQDGTDEKLWPLPIFTQLENNKQRLYWSAPNYVCENGKKLPRVLKIRSSTLFINRDILAVTDIIYSLNAAQAVVDAVTSVTNNLQLSPASIYSFAGDVIMSAVRNGTSKEHFKNMIETVFLQQRNIFSLGIFEEFSSTIEDFLEEGRFDNALKNAAAKHFSRK